MVYQFPAGYAVFGREIKVPQTFIPRVLRAIIFGKTQYETDMLNVLHVVTPSSPVTLSDCLALAGAVDNWVNSDYLPLFSGSTRYQGVHVRSMEGLAVPAYTTAGVNIPGSNGGDPLPPYVSLPVKLQSGTTGHGGHGLFHVWSPGETANDSTGAPSPAYITNVQAAITNLMSSIITAGFDPVIASFKYITIKPIISTTTRNFWGSVVSRKVEQGR